MNDFSPAMVAALIRTDLVTFITRSFETLNPGSTFNVGWYVEHLAYELQECRAGNRQRLLISAPPRYGKSTIASAIFPAWLLGHDPTLRIVGASYSQELAFRLQGDFRKIVESDWYRAAFAKFQINPAKCSEREIQTTANGGRFATSVGGPMTGLGGDMLILDDIIKADDALAETGRNTVITWLENTAFSRIGNKSTGSIIIVGQRLHPLDPIGHFEAKGGWHSVSLPVIAQERTTYRLERVDGYAEHIREVGELLDPIREPISVLNQLKLDMGVAKFNAQYLQRPEYEGDCYIDWSWFQTYETPPEFDFMFLSVDPAIATNSTSDWSACSVIGVLGDKNYIRHVERRRVGFESLANRLDYLATYFRADAIFIEQASIGISLIEHLENQKRHPILNALPVGSKRDRMMQVLPDIERGRVLVPAKAKWLHVFRSELQAFPNGVHDDQVDTLSQFLLWRKSIIQRGSLRRVHRPHLALQRHY